MAVSRINEAGLNVNQYGNRNLMINGDMQVAQRGTSSTFGQSDKGYKTVDRFQFWEQGTPTAVFALTQESTGGPVGFKYSTKLNCTTQNTSGIPASVHMYMSYKIEGNDLARLSWGSSDAKKATLSFYAKSNVSGTYVVAMRAYDGSDIDYYAAPYTLDGSGSWQYITCEIPANTITTVTSSGTGYGLALEWILQSAAEYSGGTPLTTWTESPSTNQREAGQTADIGAAVNNYWQITGIQLEVGDTATDFEHRTYGDELGKCQRYYAQGGVILSDTTPDRYHNTINLPCDMRVQPTISSGGIDSGSGGTMVSTWDSSNSSTSKRNFYQGANNSVISNSWFAFDAEF